MRPSDPKLTAILYRAFCPDTDELGEYHLGMSSLDRAAFIGNHLKECPHCQLEMQQLQKFLQDVSPDLEFKPIERLKIWIAKLLPERTDSPLPLAFGLRGEPGGQRFYQAGDAQITVEIQDDPSIPGHKMLLGLVLGIDTAGLQVYCLQAGAQVRNRPVDELGNFILTGLKPGEYDLLLQNAGLEIQIQGLSIE